MCPTHIGTEGGLGGLLGVETHLFILESPSQPFNEHSVPLPPYPVRAALNAVSLQETGKFLAGELARSLTRIKVGSAIWVVVSCTTSTQMSVVDVAASR